MFLSLYESFRKGSKFQSDLRRFILPVSNVSCLARRAQKAIYSLRSMQALESNGRKISRHASRFFTQPRVSTCYARTRHAQLHLQFPVIVNTYFPGKIFLTVKLKPEIFSQGVLIVNINLQGNVRKVGSARVARVGDPSIWDNFIPYKRGLSLFVHAGSRTYVFAQSFPLLFHCGSGEHFCFVCLVLDGRQINRLFRRVSLLCAFCLWIILQSKFFHPLILRKMAFYRVYISPYLSLPCSKELKSTYFAVFCVPLSMKHFGLLCLAAEQ